MREAMEMEGGREAKGRTGGRAKRKEGRSWEGMMGGGDEGRVKKAERGRYGGE